MSKRILTGVKPTNKAHLGNYLGAIRPAVEMSKASGVSSSLFIADYHALTSVHDAKFLKEMTYDLAATWIACGLDPEKSLIYKQSDVPETFELTWVLSCFTPKGLMNRAHAYKARVSANEEVGKKDLDDGVNAGLFTYPVLMAADILLFSADEIPVGEDQVQHIEIARDVAQKFNNTYGEVLKLPKFVLSQKQVIPGLDGRKMSKSYGNHIPLFEPSKKLRKLIMKIKTDSSEPTEPKETEGSLLFDLYKMFASEDQINALAARYAEGVGWGDVKQTLYEAVEEEVKEKREVYDELMANPERIDKILEEGAEKARAEAQVLLTKVREAVGVR